jgi:uncharacterized protein YerC
MQISKMKLNPAIEKEIKDMLAQVIADLKEPSNAHIFLRDFLTFAESLVLAKRLAILLYLEKGKSYEQIKRDLKVSSATIASVQAMLEQRSEGFMLALSHMKAEEFSEEWSQKISGFFQKTLGSKA